MSSASQQSEASWHTQMAGWVHRRSTLWVLLSLLAFAILIGHQSLGVIDRDEARFAQASKQMLTSGDYITPRFMDELRAKKPIGIYWLQSVSATLFGHADIASYRFPSLVGFCLALFWSSVQPFSLALLARACTGADSGVAVSFLTLTHC